MKFFKRLILKSILSESERAVIWRALWFSNHTFRRRGNVDGAAEVQVVMNRTEGILIPKKRTYTENEVNHIIEEISDELTKKSSEFINKRLKSEFDKGVKIGENFAKRDFNGKFQKTEECNGTFLSEGMTIERDKCETCENKTKCILFQIIFQEDEKKEARRAKAEDDGVDYEESAKKSKDVNALEGEE